MDLANQMRNARKKAASIAMNRGDAKKPMVLSDADSMEVRKEGNHYVTSVGRKRPGGESWERDYVEVRSKNKPKIKI